MRICPLSPQLVDQIAAGEVIERPASVVKELVENSLDAGAKRIEIELSEGGKRLIRVRDDGSGIPSQDLPRAFASHATSKIEAFEDLARIGTLGFRGEALASMGAVSRAKIISRVRDAQLGGQIENQGGLIQEPREAGSPFGTTVEICDLFFNLPARRKFLKSTSAELSKIVDLVFRIALPFEGVEFTLKHGEKLVFHLPAKLGLLERVRTAFGNETADGLVSLEAEGRFGKLSGFLGLPRISRSDTSRQFFYANGRFIRDRALMRALREAYLEFLPYGRQPIAFLFLGIDPSAIDQNVHPTKIEVRFREGRELFGFFLGSIREKLRASNLATPGSSLRAETPLIEKAEEKFFPMPSTSTALVREKPETAALFPKPTRPIPYLQVHNTYLVFETPEGFEVIDQHALHERVLFEGLKGEVSKGGISIQKLLVPELVEVSRADVLLMEETGESLRKAGFEVEPFGETTLAVRGVPARLRRLEIKELVEEILSIARGKKDPAKHGFLEEVLHRTACRAAVMAGDSLSQSEIEELLSKASLLEHDQTCPHSRPTRIRFTLRDLERAFHRK